MPIENLNMDEITEARRKAIKASIHPINLDELQKIGESLFPTMDHPWREKFFEFIKENAGETFHHALADDRLHIVYCHRKERGIWFKMGSGRGPLRAAGLKVLKEIVEGV